MDWNWQNFSSQWINSKSNSSNLVRELGKVTLKTFKNSSGAILWAVWCLHFLGLLYDPMVWFILHMRLEVYLFKWWREYLGLGIWHHWEWKLPTENGNSSHACIMNAQASILLPSWAHAGLVWKEMGEFSPWNPTSLKRKMSTHTDADDPKWLLPLGCKTSYTTLPLWQADFSSFIL